MKKRKSPHIDWLGLDQVERKLLEQAKRQSYLLPPINYFSMICPYCGTKRPHKKGMNIHLAKYCKKKREENQLIKTNS